MTSIIHRAISTPPVTGPELQQGWDDQAAHYTVRRVRGRRGSLFFVGLINGITITLGACFAGVIGLVICPLIVGLVTGAAQVAATLP